MLFPLGLLCFRFKKRFALSRLITGVMSKFLLFSMDCFTCYVIPFTAFCFYYFCIWMINDVFV